MEINFHASLTAESVRILFSHNNRESILSLLYAGSLWVLVVLLCQSNVLISLGFFTLTVSHFLTNLLSNWLSQHRHETIFASRILWKVASRTRCVFSRQFRKQDRLEFGPAYRKSRHDLSQSLSWKQTVD